MRWRKQGKLFYGISHTAKFLKVTKWKPRVWDIAIIWVEMYIKQNIPDQISGLREWATRDDLSGFQALELFHFLTMHHCTSGECSKALERQNNPPGSQNSFPPATLQSTIPPPGSLTAAQELSAFSFSILSRYCSFSNADSTVFLLN